MTLEVLRFQILSRIPGFVHAVTTRHGGVSQGRCESLNVSYSVGDSADNVDENLKRVGESVGLRREDLFAAYQVHGRGVTAVDADSPPRPRCDVLMTRSRDRALMLRFADCTPVLLADPKRKAVAAVHAGWRGSASRAVTAAVSALVEAYASDPRDLLAGIGPAIGPCCYEVGGDVVAAFADRPGLINNGRLDLWEANRQELVDAGLPPEHIELAGICTRCHSDRFFSHRANGGQPAGRFAAVIRLA
ncbi:MAG TPA: peptidoglycan editing factor PgeF [Chloroflexota bacterium]